jgi:hypothetical protein
LSHTDKQRFLDNLGAAHAVMTWALLIGVGLMIFLFYDEASAAYALVAVALVLQILFPLLVSQYFALARLTPSEASQTLCSYAAQVAWIPGIPGILLVILEIARKFVAGLEEQKFKRKYLKYGQGVIKTEKLRNVFLGHCWNMPFCRENVRVRCPIYLRHRGPCWRNKRGCMCDETIVLAAKSPDWKNTVASAGETLGPLPSAKIKARVAAAAAAPNAGQSLSTAFKNERCRQCVIYNLHQEQKYKALVLLAFVAVGIAFYLYSGDLLKLVAFGYHRIDQIAAHLSFSAQTPAQPTDVAHQGVPVVTTSTPFIGTAADLSGPIGWVVLVIVTMLLISKVLQLIEYACFKLKS